MFVLDELGCQDGSHIKYDANASTGYSSLEEAVLVAAMEFPWLSAPTISVGASKLWKLTIPELPASGVSKFLPKPTIQLKKFYGPIVAHEWGKDIGWYIDDDLAHLWIGLGFYKQTNENESSVVTAMITWADNNPEAWPTCFEKLKVGDIRKIEVYHDCTLNLCGWRETGYVKQQDADLLRAEVKRYNLQKRQSKLNKIRTRTHEKAYRMVLERRLYNLVKSFRIFHEVDF